MPPKFRELERLLEQNGWMLKRQKGSHRHFVHPEKPGIVTLSGKPSDTPPEGTYQSILKQAGLKS